MEHRLYPGFFFFLPWFTVVGHRPEIKALVDPVTVAIVVLFVVNIIQPIGLQLAEIERIETKLMPWGEEFASPVGRLAPSFWFAIPAALIVLGHSVVQFWSNWRLQKSGTSKLMMISAAIYFAANIEGVLVRAQIVDFVHLGPFGFFAMVIAMSLTLSYRSRHTLMVSEQRFRALVEQSPFGIQVLAADGQSVQINPAWERLWGRNAVEDSRVADDRLRRVIERAFQGQKGETNPAPSPGNQWIRSFVYPIRIPTAWCAMSSSCTKTSPKKSVPKTRRAR